MEVKEGWERRSRTETQNNKVREAERMVDFRAREANLKPLSANDAVL